MSPKRFKLIFILSFLIIISLLSGFYFAQVYLINKKYSNRYNYDNPVSLRKFPYPYRAAMTISSDIDQTQTVQEFIEIQKFLNTNEITKMGRGVGLEIGNSFFFYESSGDSISYFDSEGTVAGTIRKYIHEGYIDTLHSFGRKEGFNREDAIKALDELDKFNCKVDVWVDHTRTRDNLGNDVTIGFGDHPDCPEYHADVTLNFGLRFFWLGRVTMITGQSVPLSLKSLLTIYDADHIFYSLINISKELAKNIFAVFGNEKYYAHRENELVFITKLDDGQEVYEFMRFDNFYMGVSRGANSRGLSYVISKKTLEELINVGGYMIVYTHFGMNSNCHQYICSETLDSLRYLAKEYNQGNIFVTTTSKLLNYYVNHKYLDWTYDVKDSQTIIHIHSIKDPIAGTFEPTLKDLEEITFYVPDNKKTIIFIKDKEIKNIRLNLPDQAKKQSITITSR